MSDLYVVKWFDSPTTLAVHTEMREFEEPIEQTKAWVAEQRKPAAGVLYVLAQNGLDLRLRRSHVFFNQRGQASATFRNAIEKQVAADIARFEKNAPTPAKTKRPPTRRPERVVAKERNVGEVLAGIRGRKAAKPCTPGFTRGMQKLISERAQAFVSPRDMVDAMQRFEACDWGDVSSFETRHNNHQTGARRATFKGVYYTRRGHRKFVIVASPLENVVIVATVDDL